MADHGVQNENEDQRRSHWGEGRKFSEESVKITKNFVVWL